MKINPCKLLLVLVAYANIVNAQDWKGLNPPLNVFNSTIYQLAKDGQGNLYAAGRFINTAKEYVVVKWNGSNWSELGSGASALHANNSIATITTDANGNVYAAGVFTNTSGHLYIAKWNGSGWSQLGAGAAAFYPNNSPFAMACDKSGNLYVAGAFTDNNNKQYVAKWNGTTWSQLGTGANALNANGTIYSVTADSTGNIYAAGDFTNSNGTRYVAKWNGAAWTESGAASPLNADGFISSVKTDKAGNIYATGEFKNSSGEYFVAKCDGNSWSELGGGSTALHANGSMRALAINDAGYIYAGGFATDGGGSTIVSCWNGSSWTETLSVPTITASEYINSIVTDNTGNVYAAGTFVNVSRQSYVAKYDGTNTRELGRQGNYLPQEYNIQTMIADKWGKIYAVGEFWNQATRSDVAMWDGIGWVQLINSNSLNITDIRTIATDTAGNIYIAGGFKNLNGQYFVGKWDGTNWVEVSAGTSDLHSIDPIGSIAIDSNNNIYASGTFIINGGAIYQTAKWDGTKWSTIGSGTYTGGLIAIGPAGLVYTSDGDVLVRKWDGTQWTQLPPIPNKVSTAFLVQGIVTDKAGNVYVAGRLTNNSYNGYVAKWDGTQWSELGTIAECDYITSLASDGNGNIYAGIVGNTGPLYYVGKWDGQSWKFLGAKYTLDYSSSAKTLCCDKWGTVYAGGIFQNDLGLAYIGYYGNLALQLQQPLTSDVPAQLCNANTTGVKLLNMPDSRITVTAKLDNSPVTIGADSSFSINLSALATGNHQISISYTLDNNSTSLTEYFQVVNAVTPNVDVSANTTEVTSMVPVTITATNTSGGGTTPLFTFAKDRNISAVLQAESSNNTFNLDPATLAVGNNWIYVRMKTSESCYTALTNIDSINIIRSAATDVRDLDYPNQAIYASPVPFNESFTVKGLQTAKSYVISLIDTKGQIVLSKEVRNSQSVTIKPFVTDGVYWLSIFDNSKKRFLGVIKLIRH